MGQKSNPIGLRLQVNRTWDSRWFAEGRDYGRMLVEDLKIRQYVFKNLPQAAISKVVIERPAKLCRVSIYAARPGVIIGKKGADIEKLRKKLGELTGSDVSLNIVEIRKPEVDAKLVGPGHCRSARTPRRVPSRHEARGSVGDASGRRRHPHQLRRPSRRRGNRTYRMVPRRPGAAYTLRANVDYAESTAHTAYGVCGIKVWIFKGEILGHDPMATDRLMLDAQTTGVRPAREDRR